MASNPYDMTNVPFPTQVDPDTFDMKAFLEANPGAKVVKTDLSGIDASHCTVEYGDEKSGEYRNRSATFDKLRDKLIEVEEFHYLAGTFQLEAAANIFPDHAKRVCKLASNIFELGKVEEDMEFWVTKLSPLKLKDLVPQGEMAKDGVRAQELVTCHGVVVAYSKHIKMVEQVVAFAKARHDFYLQYGLMIDIQDDYRKTTDKAPPGKVVLPNVKFMAGLVKKQRKDARELTSKQETLVTAIKDHLAELHRIHGPKLDQSMAMIKLHNLMGLSAWPHVRLVNSKYITNLHGITFRAKHIMETNILAEDKWYQSSWEAIAGCLEKDWKGWKG